jgi:DDE superfamily endonuclease
MVPGWPYSVICALETGRSSWTAPLGVRRLTPGEDAALTAAQVRQVVTGLMTAGQWRPGDRDILVVADAGYDAPRLAYLLAGLPVAVLGRMRSDRVLRRTAAPPAPAPGAAGRWSGEPRSFQTGPVAERVRVREIDDDEGWRLVRIVRRAVGRW